MIGEGADVDGDVLTVSLVDDVDNGTLALDADGGFRYTPNADFEGTDAFTFVISDGTDQSSVATVTLTVGAVADVPVAVGDAYETDLDVVLTVSAASGVLANDTDADGDALTARLMEDVEHGTLTLNADGSFTYTPDEAFVGDDAFVYVAEDGGRCLHAHRSVADREQCGRP